MQASGSIFRLVACFVFAAGFLNAQPGTAPEGIAPEMLVRQEGCPLQVISVALSGESKNLDLLERVTLANVADKAVGKYTLGWVLADHAGRKKAGVFTGRPIEAVIAPGDTHLAPPQEVWFHEMLRLAANEGFQSGRLTVGVVKVVFIDGTEWNYDLLREGRFREKQDPAVEEKLRPVFERERRSWESSMPEQQAAGCSGAAAVLASDCPCHVIVCNPSHNTNCSFINDPRFGYSCLRRVRGARLTTLVTE